MIVIVGILSSIALPNFLSVVDKVRQKEVCVLLNGYIKAVQANYMEYGALPQNSKPLGQYVSILGCTSTLEKIDPSVCKSRPPVDLQKNPSTGWISQNGLYQIETSTGTWDVTLIATPTGGFKGYGCAACFDTRSGSFRVVEEKTKGNRPKPPECYQ